MHTTQYRLLHDLVVVYMLFTVLTSFILSLGEKGMQRCIERERLALLQLKQSFKDPYGMLSNWGDGEQQKECCNWTCIQCSKRTNHVISIHLQGRIIDDYNIVNQPLQGTISSSLTELYHLNHLNLSFNDFNGTQIPKFIGSLIHLRYLDLSFSNFGGIIPRELGNLSRLYYLNLRENILVEKIPKELGDLSSLQELYLDQNNLEGTIPHSLGNLSNIKVIALGSFPTLNNFPGKLKSNLEWLPNLFSLRILRLYGVDLDNSNIRRKLVISFPPLEELCLPGSRLPGVGFSSLSLTNCSHSLKFLQLVDNDQSGSIPLSFGDLNSLEVLYLQQNYIKGMLPNSMWNLCSLKILSLFEDDLQGRFDEFLGKTVNMPRCLHKSLQEFDLSFNHFTGSVPDLSLFSKLNSLSLIGNKLNGKLSDGIGKLSNLKFLDVSDNPLRGVITEAHFSKLSKLRMLVMPNTSLSFNISKSWIPPFQLEGLDLSYNKVGPHFSELLKNQKNIEALYMHHSEIVDVPDWFWSASLANLIDLDLSFNQIQGEIANMQIQSSSLPSIYQSTNQLKVIDLSFNSFSGGVPEPLLSLPNLKELYLQNNKFQSIPSLSSSNVTSLQYLDLSDNEISGFLPSWIGHKFPNLHFLSLRNNNFLGSLPSSICNLTQILVFDLSANHLSGFIPKCFSQFISFTNFTSDSIVTDGYDRILGPEYNLDSIVITWKGVLQRYQYANILSFQRLIDLSDNQLTGEIPTEIMDLIELVSLNLSWNKLTGEINQKIGRLNKLEILDLSKNLLHGPIPPSLSQLNFLDHLNLSYNNLSGKIPSGFQLQTLNDASAYYGNPELCGAPLDRMCPHDGNYNEGSNATNQGDDDKNNLLEMNGFYFFMAFGFILGFGASCGSLIFCNSWSYAFFNFCTRNCDNIYIKVAISINKLRTRL